MFKYKKGWCVFAWGCVCVMALNPFGGGVGGAAGGGGLSVAQRVAVAAGAVAARHVVEHGIPRALDYGGQWVADMVRRAGAGAVGPPAPPPPVSGRKRLWGDDNRPEGVNPRQRVDGPDKYRVGEKKAFDYFDNESFRYGNVNNGYRFFLLSGIVQGSDYYNRVGRRTHYHDMLVRWKLSPIASSGVLAAGLVWTVAIVYDRQPQASLPATPSVVFSVVSGAFTTSCSPVTLSNRERFSVLRHKVFYIDPYHPNICGEEYLWVGETATWNATNTGTVADCSSGAIYMLAYCSDMISESRQTTSLFFEVQSRLRFRDGN